MDNTVAVAICGLIGTVSAGALGAAGTYFVTRVQAREESRRRLVDASLHIGVESWKEQIRLAQTSGRAAAIAPLDLYLVHAYQLAQLIADDKLDAAALRTHREHLDLLYEEVWPRDSDGTRR